MKGLIFNIQRYSIHDGPGIRTTVFFKGCPLNCAWCSNPESQYVKPQLIANNRKCSCCGICVKTCPQNAISITNINERIINWSLCDNCFICVENCPNKSLEKVGLYMSIDEIVKEVEKDEIFYKNSGGGITISGGEPMLQYPFVLHLARTLKEKGYHVALDTCGYANKEHFFQICNYVDLILFDLKIIDPAAHKRYTGKDNSIIIENALALRIRKIDLWIRIPLIDGLNDSAIEINKITELAQKIEAQKISLLPYHTGGLLKKNNIFLPHDIIEFNTPMNENLEKIKRLFTEKGIMASVGN